MKSYNNHVRIEGVVRNIRYDTTLNAVYFDLHRYGEIFKCFASGKMYDHMKETINQGDEVKVSGVLIQVIDKDKEDFVTEIAAFTVGIL